MKKTPTRADISAVMKMLGKRSTPAKAAAARANGSKPCAPGKKRGRPRTLAEDIAIGLHSEKRGRPAKATKEKR